MLYLAKLKFNIDGHIGCVKRGVWCQEERHQIGDVAGPHTYQLVMM